MKPHYQSELRPFSGARVTTCALAAAIFALGVATGICKPRPPTPPLPCIGLIHTEDFDEPLRMPSDQVIDPSVWAESWSGYCLDRSSTAVAPWAIPMAGTDRAWVDSVSGAIRFWYRPGYDSGTGPGQIATLLTLVSANNGSAITWWTLAVSQNATNLLFLCQDGGDLVPCLSAPTAFQAGTWALITLCYSETNCAIFINDTMVAAGGGLPALPTQVVPYTSLIVGSRADGLEAAAGQIEELACFSGNNGFRRMTGSPFGLSVQWDIADYWTILSPVAALGPITPEEEAAQAQIRAQRRAARQLAALNTPMGLDGPDGPLGDAIPCGTNDIRNVWMTNIVCISTQGQGWTVTFQIAGGTNEILYDVFGTSALTNSAWVWITNGPACSAVILTNQWANGGFYILGIPLDSDHGGLTDAYEQLVTHGDVNDPADDRPMPPGMSVAILDSQLTRSHWSSTNWNYFVMPESMKEALRSDGTPFTVVGDTTIAKGLLLTNDEPRYPILISLAAEAIGDDEIGPLTNYVAKGGFLLVGSSSFTRDANGTRRPVFPLGDQMGMHYGSTTSWVDNSDLFKQSDHRLVGDLPFGQLTWRMPTFSEEISWGLCTSHPFAGTHQIWPVSTDTGDPNLQVLARGDGNGLAYIVVKKYGNGYFIYHAALQPLIGHGGFAPSMYAYAIFRRAIEWAFESAHRPVAKLSPWPYQHDAAFMIRHDYENFDYEVSHLTNSALYESAHGAWGDYYFCTGTVRSNSNPAAVIAGLRQAVTNYGSTIGPHNGGLKNPLCDLTPDRDDYWHWGPDEALDANPPGYTDGYAYAFTSISNSFSDVESWLAGLTSGLRLWVSPYFNATREGSYRIQEQLAVNINGEQKLTPFPHWTLSTQTDGRRYRILSEPISDWFVGGLVAQSLEDWHPPGVHTYETLRQGVNSYYQLGALINFYSHSPSDGTGYAGELVPYYITNSLDASLHPYVWSTNAAGVYHWWVQRSSAQIVASYTLTGTQSTAAVAIWGAVSPDTAVEFLSPYSAAEFRVFTNGSEAGLGAYRTNGQLIKVRVGTTVTNVALQYVLGPKPLDDAYNTLQDTNSFVVPDPGVLANDWPGTWPGLIATNATTPQHGSLLLSTNGGFSYKPDTSFYGRDCFTYEVRGSQGPFGTATVTIFVLKQGALFNDDFARCGEAPYPLDSWQTPFGEWAITNAGANPLLQGRASRTSEYGYCYHAATWTNANYSVHADIQFPSAAFGGGLGGRLNPYTGEHYALWIYPDNSTSWLGTNLLALIRFDDWDTWTPLETFALPSVGTNWHPVSLVLSNDYVMAYYHGTNVISVLDTNLNSPGGISLDMWTDTTAYRMSADNIIVTPVTP